MKKLILLSFLFVVQHQLLQAQTCCPSIKKSSLTAGSCYVTNGGTCNLCKGSDVLLSIEDGASFPAGGQVSWYYSATSGFNPAIGQGTLIGSLTIPNSSCDDAPSVKFNEIMVKPTNNNDDMSSPTTGEWIELIGPPGTDLGCYIISDGDWAITIPPGYSIPSDGLFVIGFTATAGGAVDLDVAGCGCTTGAVNKVLTLDDGGEWLAIFDGFSTVDAFKWGSPSLFNTFPFGDLIAGGKIPGAMLIGCVQDYTPGFPTFDSNSNTTSGGQTYSRKPDYSGNWDIACATIGACNTGGNIFPMELQTNFANLTCNQTVYIKGIVTPKATGCTDLVTPQYSLFVSCPITDINKKLCYDENLIVNGNTYDVNNPAGQEVIVGGSYLGCDSTVNVSLTFNPEVTASISGDFDICLGQIVSIPVTFTGIAPFTFSYNINGTLDNTITTTDNPYILKLSPKSSITVSLADIVDKNDCNGKVDGEVTINVDAPVASLSGLNIKQCEGDTISLPVTLTGLPDFKFIYFINGVPQAEITTALNPYYLKIIAKDSLIISLKEMTDDQGCNAKISGKDSIYVFPAIKINNIVENCYPGNTYDVSFILSGGDASTWTVIGPGVLTDSLFVSSSFPGGTTYQFIIKDSTGCTLDTLSNTVTCNCLSQVGKMDQTVQHSCIDGIVTAIYDNTGQVINSGDVLKYILHDNGGNSPGTIFATSDTPSFGFIVGMIPEKTYYISAVIGLENPLGSIDLLDACLQTSKGTPIIFHDFPSINSPADTNICVGDCVEIDSKAFGHPPFNIDYSVISNTGTQTFNNNAPNDSLKYTYCPDIKNGQGITKFIVTKIVDKYCTLNLMDEVKIIVGETSVKNFNKDLCLGQNIVINGNTYDESNPMGMETLSKANYLGCDSIININLKFVQTVVENMNPQICPSSNITINGIVFDANNPFGSFNFPGGSVAGCDSTLNVQLSFYSVDTTQLAKTLCKGESIKINGKIYDVNNPEGTENLVGQAWNGCDSIVHIQLNILPAIFTLYKDTLCVGEMITVHGTVYDFNKPAGLEVFKNGSYTGCDSTVQVQLLFNSEVNANISGPTSICPGETLLITLHFDQGGNYDVTLDDGKGGTISLNNVSDGFQKDLGIYAVASSIKILSVTPIGNNCKVNIGPSLDFLVGQLAVNINKTSSYNGFDVSCTGEMDGGLVVNPTSGAAPYTYIWSTGQTKDSILNIGAGNYTVTITDTKGCSAISTLALEEPTPIILNAMNTNGGCDSLISGSIVITNIEGGTGTYNYSLNNGIPALAANSFKIDNLSPGTYNLMISDANGCSASQNFTINKANSNTLSMDAGADVELDVGKQWGLQVKTNFIPVNIIWHPEQGLDCSNCLNPVVRIDTTTTYTIVAKDNNGCEVSDTITIYIIDPNIIFVPNVFSPDGDGTNDRLVIFASDNVAAIKKFEVFDRWGENLYSAENIPVNDVTVGWDGKQRGQKAAFGVYVYYVLVELKNGSERLYKGDVSLIR